MTTQRLSILSSQVRPALAVAMLGIVAFAAPAEASSRWGFARDGIGGNASSCDRFDGDQVCAVVYCDGGELEFALSGWDPRGRSAQRDGEIIIDGRSRSVGFQLTNRGDNALWRADLNRRASNSVISDIKAGSRLEVEIGRRDFLFDFTLRGSSAAVGQLERNCDRRYSGGGGGGGGDVRPEDVIGGVAAAILQNILRGADNQYQRGWELIAVNDVERRNDRDVVELSRRDGRFDALILRARGGAVRIRSMIVRYGNGAEEELDVDRRLRAGEMSNVLELRGARGRYIDRITFVYRSRGRGADLEVWGHRQR